MAKVILIHANCNDPNARGDFVFAANIAKDMVHELHNNGKDDIDVVLVSSLDGVPRFISIYGPDIDGRIVVEDTSIGLSSLEEFDAVENRVVAFIDANRCKHSAATLVKKVLSPDSKVLFVGNANQHPFSNVFMQTIFLAQAFKEQPGVYHMFDKMDLLIGSAGVGPERLGLPTIRKAEDLPPIASDDQFAIPQEGYGFSYINTVDPDIDYYLIAQYFKLNGQDYQIVVGEFTDKHPEISSAYYSDSWLQFRVLPEVKYYQSLPNRVMRQIVAHSTSTLVLSTGVTSTLEVMRDSKLPFYQDIPENSQFVGAYLIAVKSIVLNDRDLSGALPQLIIELSGLLFAEKPLDHQQMIRTNELLDSPSTRTSLISANQTLMDQASGKIAPRLLGFLNNPRKTSDQIQLATVCSSLRKPGETGTPVHDQALRRAATWGRLFELKVLIKSMTNTDINKVDSACKRTALHWAVVQKEFDCARELIKSGALLDIQDYEGQTALHKAVENGDRQMIKMLIEAGASLSIEEEFRDDPEDGVPVWSAANY